MKAVILNCFDTYEERVDLLYSFLSDYGYDVKIIQSDYRHFKKIRRTDRKKNFIFVRTLRYKKNISFLRLLSHYRFSQKAIKIVKKIKPDLMYAVVPPNSLAQLASNYKKKNSNLKLILDIIDIWPETFPVGNVKYLPLFKIWSKLRDDSIKNADYVITECNLYKSKLKNLIFDKSTTVYLAKKSIQVKSNPYLKDNEIHLAYLGSINNIIDISKIVKIIEIIMRFYSVTLHIIGDGESKDIFIKETKKLGIKVLYYGVIHDSQEKQNIFDECHFGLNIMKDTVNVGLTMKSIDYLQHGLPLINNIPEDTYKLVSKYNIGINAIDLLDFEKQIETIKCSEIIEMKNNSIKTFKELFSEKSFNSKMKNVMKKLNL